MPGYISNKESAVRLRIENWFDGVFKGGYDFGVTTVREVSFAGIRIWGFLGKYISICIYTYVMLYGF